MLSKEESGQFIDFIVPSPLPQDETRRRLVADGWREDAKGSYLVRGSRVWTRLWGVHLVSIAKWPMIAEVLTTESGTAVRVRDNAGRMWSWSVPNEDGQVAGGAAGRMASGVDAFISGARQIEEDLTRLLSE